MEKILNKKGSVALVGILMISAILLIAVLGISETQITTGFQYVNNTAGKDLYYAAESCLEEAIIRIESDPSFSTTTILAGDAQCVATVSGTTWKKVDIGVSFDGYSQIYQADVIITQNGNVNNARLSKWGKIQ